MPWNPTTIRRPDKAYTTSTETVRVTTDAGPGFLKALGNRGSPHYLAADLVATQLAAWLGLPTFEFALIEVTTEDEIKFPSGRQAQPGRAFITREELGMTWDGTAEGLNALVNPHDLGKLVLFDTWTRNCDRYLPGNPRPRANRGNVFLSSKDMADGQLLLVAMDHTHCFNGERGITAQLSNIDIVQDDQLYGLFPEFRPFLRPHWPGLLTAVAQLRTVERPWIQGLVNGIPDEWSVDATGRAALVKLVYDRARYVADTFVPLLETQLG